MAGYQSTHTGAQIDNIITLVDSSTDKSGTNVPSSSNKIATLASLPASGNSVLPSMDGTASGGTAGQYATADHVHPTDTSRQAALVSGTNIKTIEGTSILGSGNIDITASDVGLGNVTNESKATMFTSPTFTGTPIAPTATAGTDNTQIATTAFVQAAVAASPQSMIFKGTIGSAGGSGTTSTIPTSNVSIGDTWMIVDEEKTLAASASATGNAVLLEIGDLIIATATTPKWITSPSKEDIGVTSVAAGTGLVTDQTGGTAITTSGTISLDTSGVTAGTYGSSSSIPSITVDTYGRVTAASGNSISIPEYSAGPGIDITSNTVSETYTTCTLPAFAAAGSKNVAVTGITANSHPTLDVYIADSSSVSSCNEAWSHIYRADTYAGGITFYSDAATSVAVTVMIKGY